jgi:tetratricopeptide (TPR) repeat protein
MRRNSLYFSIVFVFLSMLCSFAYAQPTWTFDPFGKEKKPEEYVERKLPSEKTADKKFTRVRQFIQNTTTHYNFYFNANNKLNTVIENAKFSQVDDYSNLISFYPYSLENTASQSVELDSVIFKSTGGILLHDLRSDWVDNMYLLIGKAYYFKKVFDSAALTFQFINYNLFPREKNEDDSRVVGTNSSGSTTKLSIANREKRNFIKRVLSMPPSRNEALIWQARTYIESNMYGEAAGLINILQEDPNLPKRLKDDLNQVTAFWYYKQEGYDSAAVYLEKGLSSADNKSDKCRWEFLLGQLFDMNGQFDKANDYYLAAAKNTVDPLMDIYARLNKAKLLRNSGNAKELENSISLLLRMAKRDKYETYKDIIYHSAGLLTLQKPDTVNAIALLEKSLKLNENNVAYKNKTHLALGRIAFKQRNYKVAADHYDSLDVSEKAILKDSVEVADRKSSLRQIAVQLNIIEREDSLQKIASLSPEQRDQFIKKLIKKHKKEQGVKEEETIAPENLLSSFDNGKNSVAIDLFSNSTKGGEWYFYNSSMKSKGFSEFKSKWGKRDNTDNWRIKSSSRLSNKKGIDNLNGDPMAPQEPSVDSATGKPVDFSYDALMLNVPTTEDKMDSSNFYIQNALMELARVFQFELKDYHQALETYAVLMKRYPDKLF